MGSKYAKLREEVKELEDLTLKLYNYKNRDLSAYFDELYKNLKLINKQENNIRDFKIPKKLYAELRKYYTNLYMEVNAIEIFSKFLNKMVSGIFEKEEDSEIDSRELDCFSILSNILINSSDAVLDFGEEICENDDLLKLFYKILVKFKEKIVIDGSPKVYIVCVKNIVYILYNTVIHESIHNIMKMREYKFVEIMKDLYDITYLNWLSKKRTNFICLTAILFTSYVVDEDNVHMITGHEELICHIISVVEESLKDENECYYTTEELTKGILQLSKNDNNKLLLVNCKILPLLNELLDKNSIEIQKTALLILWNLTFLADYKRKIERKFLVKIKNIRNNLDKYVYQETDTAEFLSHFNDIIHFNPESGNEIDELRQTLDKVVWVLKNEGKQISNEVITKTPEDMIMISYSHGEKEIVEKLHAELKGRNYKGICECDKIIPVSAAVTQDKPPNKVSRLASWTNADVIKWLQEIGVTTINAETKWKGKELEFLKDLDKKTFAEFCKEGLGVCDLTDTIIIYEELQKL